MDEIELPVDPAMQALFDKYPGLEDKSTDFVNRVASKELSASVDQFLRSNSFNPPEVIEGSLGNFLDQSLPDTQYLIEGLTGVGHNTTITAKFKTGKTTLLINLIRSLLDNEPFLGQFKVKPLDGRIVLLNYEMDSTDLQRDLLKLKIENTGGMAPPVNLRGSKLDLVDPRYQEWLIEYLKSQDSEVLMIDTYTAALAQTAIDENDNSGVGRFTSALDLIKKESGVSNLFITAHMGRANFEEGEERTRGATRLNDWQDVGWTYARKSGDVAYLASHGRQRTTKDAFSVEFDHETLLLSSTGRTRTEVRAVEHKSELKEKIVFFLAGCKDPQSKNTICTDVGGRRQDVMSAVDELVTDGDLISVKGPRGSLFSTKPPPEGVIDLHATL